MYVYGLSKPCQMNFTLDMFSNSSAVPSSPMQRSLNKIRCSDIRLAIYIRNGWNYLRKEKGTEAKARSRSRRR